MTIVLAGYTGWALRRGPDTLINIRLFRHRNLAASTVLVSSALNRARMTLARDLPTAGAASRAETRRQLIAAARELFSEQGYSATTVTKIARRAGVSLQTLYLACGSKRELLQVVLSQALSGTPSGIGQDYLTGLRAQMASVADETYPEPERTLRAFTRVFRTIAERAETWWRVYRDAAAIDPEIAEDWATLTARRRTATAALLQDLADAQLPPGLTRRALTDTVWAIASPETCQLLRNHAGYTLDDYERWMADTLSRMVDSPA